MIDLSTYFCAPVLRAWDPLFIQEHLLVVRSSLNFKHVRQCPNLDSCQYVMIYDVEISLGGQA
jgi:hypothetical protein